MQIFSSARLKLTLWYLLIIGFISLTFSFVIYRLQTREITRFEQLQRQRIEARIEQGMGLYNLGPRPSFIYIDEELIAETKRRIIFVLGLFNGSVLLVAGVLGYFLAGRTLEPIQNMVTEQERFIGDASHELRTPLTVMRTSLEVYERSKHQTKEAADSLIVSTLGEVKRLQKLSDSLLKLSASKNEFNSLVHLEQLIDEVVTQIKPLADKKKINFTVSKTIATVKGDESSLTELINILVDNAVKYSSPNSKVKISLSKTSRIVKLSVSDQGIGISSTDLPHIFDRFYRADTARSEGGYGLGLAIAKSIVNKHGGKIICQSKLKVGSVFIVTLPFSQA